MQSRVAQGAAFSSYTARRVAVRMVSMARSRALRKSWISTRANIMHAFWWAKMAKEHMLRHCAGNITSFLSKDWKSSDVLNDIIHIKGSYFELHD